MIQKGIQLVKDFFFPPYCLICKEDGSLWCKNCQKKWMYQPIQKCIVCKKQSPNGKTHTRCQKDTKIDYFLRFGKYDKQIQEVIYFLKFHHGKDLAKDLAWFYLQTILNNQEIIPRESIITPIPIHYFRKLERGFNQSEALAKELSKLSQIPTLNLLRRTRHTKRQSDLNKIERQDNIKGAFKIIEQVQSKTIILLDDIATTGNTLNEAAKTLKENKVQKVIALCLARG